MIPVSTGSGCSIISKSPFVAICMVSINSGSAMASPIRAIMPYLVSLVILFNYWVFVKDGSFSTLVGSTCGYFLNHYRALFSSSVPTFNGEDLAV